MSVLCSWWLSGSMMAPGTCGQQHPAHRLQLFWEAVLLL